MAIPSSGTINLGMLITEFGGGDNLLDFYRGGGLVPDIPANAGVPTSGAINLRQFLGATVSQIGAPSSMLFSGMTIGAPNNTGFRLNITTGYVEKYQNGSYSNAGSYRWAQGTFTPSLYECMVTMNTGTMTSGSTGVWLQLSSHRLWYLTRSAVGVATVTCTLTIRRISDAAVMSTSSITVESERDSEL